MQEMHWVDDFTEAWAREYPDADTSGMLLIARLARLSVLIDTFARDTLDPFHLMQSDYAVLAALRRVGPPYTLAPNELYTGLERSSGGMTKMLRRLEGLGLVRRVKNPADKRSKLVRLTAAGKRVEEEAFEAFMSRAHELLGPLSDLATINESVQSLVAIIEDRYRG
jgi:DNA-binding MarR family transcriptional regulator